MGIEVIDILYELRLRILNIDEDLVEYIANTREIL